MSGTNLAPACPILARTHTHTHLLVTVYPPSGVVLVHIPLILLVNLYRFLFVIIPDGINSISISPEKLIPQISSSINFQDP